MINCTRMFRRNGDKRQQEARGRGDPAPTDYSNVRRSRHGIVPKYQTLVGAGFPCPHQFLMHHRQIHNGRTAWVGRPRPYGAIIQTFGDRATAGFPCPHQFVMHHRQFHNGQSAAWAGRPRPYGAFKHPAIAPQHHPQIPNPGRGWVPLPPSICDASSPNSQRANSLGGETPPLHAHAKSAFCGFTTQQNAY